jgi:hypothetical protein
LLPEGLGFFCLLEVGQGRFPSFFELGRDEAIIGIHPIELSLSQSGFIAESFQLLLVCAAHSLHCFGLSHYGSRVNVQFDGGQG